MIEIIDKKRRGESHSEAEIFELIRRMMVGEVPDYQLSAWLMAVCINGLTLDETTWLTDAYVQSGRCLDLSALDGVVVDKHSTGGVGDKTTLVLIPLLAASGVNVAKLSGRGLGFTGGTVDKLEAIPGFQVSLPNDAFVRQIQQIGVAISSQTSDLAPADGKLYALRDVTATVQSIPLIAASVVSKKIAAGAQVIVLDIKYGRGAFMETLAEAKDLAATCRAVGKRLGRPIATVISSMHQPLGYAVGHSLEAIETIETLKGRGPADLRQLCLTLGAVALVNAGLQPDIEQAERKLAQNLDDGSALRKFEALICAQAGDVGIITDYTRLPQAKAVLSVQAPQSGVIQSLDSLQIAQAAKVLGAGRNTKDDVLDLGVGVVLRKKVGESASVGDCLAELYVGEHHREEAKAYALAAFKIGEGAISPPALMDEVVL